jgi:hypothetical protein
VAPIFRNQEFCNFLGQEYANAQKKQSVAELSSEDNEDEDTIGESKFIYSLYLLIKCQIPDNNELQLKAPIAVEFNIVRLDSTVFPETFQTNINFEDFKSQAINLMQVPPSLREKVELGYRYPSGKALRGPVMSFKDAAHFNSVMESCEEAKQTNVDKKKKPVAGVPDLWVQILNKDVSPLIDLLTTHLCYTRKSRKK